jgi:spoIIIJ-associated protein
MRYFEIEGTSPEEALNKFINENKFPREFIEYEVIEEGSKGFLGFGKKPALIKIVLNDVEYTKRKSKLILSELLEKAGFTDFRIETKEYYKDYILNIESPDSSLLIGKMAQTLDALQFLVDKMLGNMVAEDINVVVDVEGYRYRVIKHLKNKAAHLAEKVRRTGKPEKLAPMVTIIRKEIHQAIKKMPGVRSESYGTGIIKTLQIVPDKQNKSKG